MSNLSKIAILTVGLGIGYVIEPNIFPRGKKEVSTPVSKEISQNEPESIDQPQTKIDLDLTKLIPADFPEKIELYEEHSLSDAATGVTMTLKKGTLVKPVSINGNNIVIQPIGIPINSEINADHTNFKQLALPKLIERLTKATETPQTPEPTAPEPTVPEPTAPMSEAVSPAPASDNEEAAPAIKDPAPVKTEASAEVSGTGISEEEIITIMKANVEAGKVMEFTTAQVTSWEMGKEEVIGNVTYQQSGRVRFVAQTILGKQTHGAIALIKDGKIEKWVWAKNMLEMR